MSNINQRFLRYFILLCVLLSITVICINLFVFQYPGNDYFFEGNLCSLLIVILIYAGFFLLFGENSQITQFSKELLYFFTVWFVMWLMTYAVQFTPFPVIDTYLVEFDKYSYLHLDNLITWTHDHPRFRTLLDYIYESLAYQVFYIPIIMIFLKRVQRLHEYYCLLIIAMFIGTLFYYFFPTMAPASFMQNPYFMDIQKATGLKFQQIHQHIQPTTMEGGMISMPSFHVIWAYLMIYLSRGTILCWILFPINMVLALSCILLGWHYPVDLLGSAIVIGLAHGLFHGRTAIRPRYNNEQNVNCGQLKDGVISS